MFNKILNNVSRGFFYTIGRMIAYFIIGGLIGLILLKLGGSI